MGEGGGGGRWDSKLLYLSVRCFLDIKSDHSLSPPHCLLCTCQFYFGDVKSIYLQPIKYNLVNAIFLVNDISKKIILNIQSIDLFHNGGQIKYSFVFMLIGLSSLVTVIICSDKGLELVLLTSFPALVRRFVY